MKVLIFDFDGVIVDSLAIHFKNYNLLCNKYGLRRFSSVEAYVKAFDRNFYDIILQQGFAKDQIRQMNKDWKQLTIKILRHTPPFAGIRDAIQELSKSHTLYIVTSNLTELVKDYLEFYDMNYFQEILGAEQGFSKVKKLTHIKSQFPNASIFYIGDTVGDIIESREAGLISVSVTWGYSNMKDLIPEKPDHLFKKISQLKEFFS